MKNMDRWTKFSCLVLIFD